MAQWPLITDEIIIALDNIYTDHLKTKSQWFGIIDGESASAFVTYVDAVKTSMSRIFKNKTSGMEEERKVLAQLEGKINYVFDDAAFFRIGDLPIITPSVPMDIVKWLSNGALSIAEVSVLDVYSFTRSQTRSCA